MQCALYNSSLLRRAALPALSLWLCANHAANAQESGDTDTLPTLSIEADSSQPVGDVEHEDFAGRYTRIDASTLQRDNVSLGEVLAFESGVQHQQIGGYGTFNSITVRASTPMQTDIYLDGIRLNGAANAIVDLATFDLDSLDSIDIYRGAAPLQLGSANLGGAVNLNTKAFGSDLTAVRFSAGSFNTLTTHLAHRATHNRWQSIAAVEAGSSENNFDFNNDNSTPLNTADDQRQRRNNAAVKKIGLLSKLKYQHDDQSSTDIMFQHTQRSSGVPEMQNRPSNQASYDDGTGQLHLSHRINSGISWNRRHSAFLQWTDDHFDDRLSQVGLAPQDFRSEQRVAGLTTYWDRFSRDGKWAATAEFRQASFDSNDPGRFTPSVSATRQTLFLGIGYTRFALQERLLVTPRLRVQQHSSEWDSTQNTRTLSTNGNVVTPEISVRFDQRPGLRWSSSIGRHYRIPTFTEMFGTQGLTVGNDTLKPEHGINAEFALQWQAKDNIDISATVFHSDRTDAIAAIFDAQGVGRHVNIGKARITGLELEANWYLSKRVKVQANITSQNAINLSKISSFTNKQLPGQSALTSLVRLNFQYNERWKFWSEMSVNNQREQFNQSER